MKKGDGKCVKENQSTAIGKPPFELVHLGDDDIQESACIVERDLFADL